MLFGGLQKTTLVDYSGKVAATIFTAGCNFRCPYCHNPELVLPELIGKIDGMSVRVPTLNVSLVDLNFWASRETSVEEINNLFKSACEGDLGKVLKYNDKPLVSIDFNHDHGL